MSAAHASPGAAVYAKALAEAAEAAGGLDEMRSIGEALDAIGEAWEKDKVFRAFFLSAEIASTDKGVAMDKLTSAGFPRLVANFLRLAYRRGRLALLPEMAYAYRELLDEKLGRVPVTITTAAYVDPDRLATWKEQIRAAVSGEPVVEHVVRPEIIAGAIIRVGDRVMDGSGRRHLAELEQRIVQRGMQTNALQS